MLSNFDGRFRRRRLPEKPAPVRDAIEQRLDSNQRIVPSDEMRAGAAPRILVRKSDEPGAHRVELDVARGSQSVLLVHYERGESPLPEVSLPSLPRVDLG